MSKKVLIITCRFPPRLGIGPLRFRGLAKYLPEFGWEPIILTEPLPGEPGPGFNVIQVSYPGSVIKRLTRKLGLSQPQGIHERTGGGLRVREGKISFMNRLKLFVSRTILHLNKYRGLCLFLIRAAKELLQSEKIDAVISGSPPELTHVVAKQVKANCQIPWIADLRDLWTQNHCYLGGPIARWIERKLEVKVLSRADALVTVSEPLAEKLRSLHKDKPIFAIPNGFDPAEIGQAPPTKDFTITYAGQVHAGKQDPCPLFQAVQELIAEGAMDPTVTTIRFFGRPQRWLEQEIKAYKLERIAHEHGIVPREMALKKERESQLLLLLNWTDPNELGIYTGKVFEYLAAGRPILAVGGPRGVVSELMEQTNAGIHVSDLPSLKKALANYYKEYENTGQVAYHGKERQIHKYSHYEMARKFAEALDSVTR